MSATQIDYSEISTGPATGPTEEWEPPVHKYFGKKLPNGKTEKEPVYVYQEYPRMMYAQRDGKIVARVVNTDQEKSALGQGWETTPAAFGYIGAPSFEQSLAMRSAALVETDAVVAEVPRRGRPPKGE